VRVLFPHFNPSPNVLSNNRGRRSALDMQRALCGLTGDDVAIRRRGLGSRLPEGGDSAEEEGDEGPWMGRHRERAGEGRHTTQG